MSKVDELRALREARYAAGKSTITSRPLIASKSVTRGSAIKPPAKSPVVREVCGHQAISGKRCIRDKDHAEKNHRYAKS